MSLWSIHGNGSANGNGHATRFLEIVDIPLVSLLSAILLCQRFWLVIKRTKDD